MKYCVIDLESIPCQSLSEDLKVDFIKTVKAGNLGPEKAQEKIDKKMSLDPDLCEVVCFVVYDSPTNNIGMRILPDPNIVKDAWTFIENGYLNHIPLVSFNGIAFDLPVLLHSAMRLNIPVNPEMYRDLTRKYENKFHYDLMQWFSGWDRTKWKSLDFYLKLFNIGEKSGNGSEIYTWWKSGEYDKIREHCEADTRLTAKLFERVSQWIVREE